MAGTLFQDNLSPYLTAVEQGSTPASPSAGNQKLFIRTSDHLLCYVNSSGTVTPVSAGGSGSITSSGYTMNTARLLGRTTASAGAVEEITVGSGLTLSAGSLTASAASGIIQSATAQRTAGNLTTTSATFVDATDLTVTLTTGAHRLLISFNGMALNTGAAKYTCVDIVLDGVSLSGNGYGLALFSGTVAGSVNIPAFLTSVLSAGSHTIKVQFRQDGGSNTAQIYGTTVVNAAKLTVLETGLTT